MSAGRSPAAPCRRCALPPGEVLSSPALQSWDSPGFRLRPLTDMLHRPWSGGGTRVWAGRGVPLRDPPHYPE